MVGKIGWKNMEATSLNSGEDDIETGIVMNVTISGINHILVTYWCNCSVCYGGGHALLLLIKEQYKLDLESNVLLQS